VQDCKDRKTALKELPRPRNMPKCANGNQKDRVKIREETDEKDQEKLLSGLTNPFAFGGLKLGELKEQRPEESKGEQRNKRDKS